MHEKQFEYGALARGFYLALWPLALVIALYFPQWIIAYVAGLLLLGLGLRPLLEHTGACSLYVSLAQAAVDRKDRRLLAHKQAQAERKARDEKYRKSHYRDPRLPKNW
jgi:hypothetical protein